MNNDLIAKAIEHGIREGLAMIERETKNVERPEPVAPEGYEFCKLEEADKEEDDRVWQMYYLANEDGGRWSNLAACSVSSKAAAKGDEVYLRKTTPEPVIPLGYAKCSLEEADKDEHSGVLQMYIYAEGEEERWSVMQSMTDVPSAAALGKEIYLRCILPPDVAAHWKPAPGATHEEQRKNAWPMGMYDGVAQSAHFVEGGVAGRCDGTGHIPLVPRAL